MRIRAVAAALALVLTTACAGGGFFRQYEYDEEVYLSLDGSATVYVNASIPALNALRGTSFDTSPNAPVDRDAVRALFSTPVARINGQVKTSRRSNRRFVHVKLDVADIHRLSDASPFAWSTYNLTRDGAVYKYRQVVGPAAAREVGDVGWTGHELVAFRLHLPSRIQYHNNGRPVERGNILVWEQPLSERLRGTRLALDANMDTESILYTTLWLFGWTFIAVAITFVLVIWWIFRRAPAQAPAPTH
jgi:hypothetical protein